MVGFIPGEVIAALTFPGVIVHEAAHMLFCRMRRVAIMDVCFFRFGNPAGYVIHEQMADFLSTFAITVGPVLVNSILCFLICFPAFLPLRAFDQADPLSIFLLWLGVSIGMHAFPSTADAKGLWDHAKRAAGGGNPLAMISFPLVILIYLANIGSILWLDLLYGIGIGIGLPMLLIDSVV